MTHRIIYGGVEVTEWCGGIVALLHDESIEVDGLFVKPRGSPCLEATEFETSGP